jgi:hypothetical protein
MKTIKAKIGVVHTFDLNTKSHNSSIIKKEITDIINNFHPINMSKEGVKEYRDRYKNVEVVVWVGYNQNSPILKFNTNELHLV